MSDREPAEIGLGESQGRRRLSDVIVRRRDDIVRRFVAAIRGGDLAPDGATRSQIVDHVPLLLDEIAAAFGGAAPGETHPVAPEHGRQRWQIGYPLAALIHEYAILQRIICQVGKQEHADLTADEWGALSTCLIDHVADAATAYSEHRDEELARERERLAFVGEAGRLLTSSLDSEAILTRLAGLVVPRLADWCVVHLLDNVDPGSFAITHVDPAKAEILRRIYARFPPAVDAPFGTPAVLRTGRSDRMEDVPAGLVEAQAQSPEHRALLAELGCRSWMVVPLQVQENVFGALVLAAGESGRRFTAIDQALAEELATRAAIAIENGRLYKLSEDARARMEEAARVKDEFVAIVSHELRTPLTSILGWAAILKNPALSPLEVRRGIDVIERNARAQTQIVSDLLDVNRLVGGHLRIEFASLEVAPVVNQVVEAFRCAATAKDIDLRVAVEGDDLIVRGDSGRLLQVVWNLVANAVKFTQRAGRVVVSVARRGSDIAVVVSDDGIGITAQFMPHLFESFRQSDGGSTRAHGGLGVGLWLAKQLVELHGGTLVATSAGPDQGSQFTVLLPSVQSRPESDVRVVPADDVGC